MASGDGKWSCDTDDIAPDQSLMTWEKWVDIRKKQTKVLAEKTERPPADLAMNLCEKVREKKEQKIVLENAKLQKKVTTCRGTHWDQPDRLKQCCYCQPVYEVHRTPTDVGRPPVVEHIGVPKCIQENEKGMSGVPERNPCKKLDAAYVKYREAHEKKYKNKIKKIDPYKAEIDGLVLRGVPVHYPKRKLMLFVPPITISEEITDEEHSSPIYAFKINKTILLKEQPGQILTYIKTIQNDPGNESCKSWSYYFNVRQKKASRAQIYLENLGTATVRYYWKKLRRSVPFVPEDTHGQVFFFNKNEDVLSPGQNRTIPITFMSDKAGIFSESWELCTSNVTFLDAVDEILAINLYADAFDNIPGHTRKIEKVIQKIQNKAIYHFMYKIVVGFVNKATAVEPPIYPYKKMLLEKDMFLLKNPVCYYHQTEVAKLNALYTEMQLEKVWDWSLATWRQAMMEKEFDDRMYYYDILKTSHSVLLKPWYEGISVEEEKQRAVKTLLEQLANTFDREYIRLSKLYSSKVYNAGVWEQCLRNVFYISMCDHVRDTIELCVGVISSLDLNRFIDFDFCRSHRVE